MRLRTRAILLGIALGVGLYTIGNYPYRTLLTIVGTIFVYFILDFAYSIFKRNQNV